MAGKPETLLIDHLALNLGPARVSELFRDLLAQNITLIVADRFPLAILPLAGRALFLHDEKIAREGDGHTLMGDPDVVAACLGDRLDNQI